MKLLTFFKSHKLEFLMVTALLILAAVSHGWNMFHYPYYENDEGAYMSQAWSLVKFGKLAPYTYWYDHAPGGWILIALWTLITGGFFTFGMSINSGRVLMLVLHVAITLFVYLISKRLTGNIWSGIIAGVIFSLSPLGIYFQRRVLLDNLMTFWIFFALWLLLLVKVKLRYIYMSAIAFGFAVLTKENAIFLMPGFLYVLYERVHSFHKRLAILQWIFVAVTVISLYFLYAILKSELLPPGLFGDTSEHVSLLATLKLHSGRGINLPFWYTNSDFFLNFIDWFNRDKFIVSAGFIATAITTLLSIKVKAMRIPSLFTLLMLAFLMRGSLVIVFYVVPLIPLFAMNIAFLIDFIVKHLSFSKKKLYHFLMLVLTVVITGFYFTNSLAHFVHDETTSQIKAVDWIKDNLPQNTFIVIDNYSYVDLHDKRWQGDKVFPNADWFWKLQSDPEIRDAKYHNDWSRVEYIALSHEMLRQTKQDNTQNFIDKAFDSSYLVQDWKEGSTSYFDMKHYISTNGDWMSMYKLKDKENIMLSSSWNFFKSNYFTSYGQIRNPVTKSTSTKDQANAMLRTVWAGDKESFDGIWSWTKDHFQHRADDKLLSSEWKNSQLVNSDSDAVADQDIALALLLAYKTWGDESYKKNALILIDAIWDKEIKQVGGLYTLTNGSGDSTTTAVSNLAPFNYKLFAQFDQDHPWEEVADDAYERIQKNDGDTDLSVSCMSLPNRLALDELFFSDQRAVPIANAVKVSSTSAITNISLLSITNKQRAASLFDTKLEKTFNYDSGYWNPKNDFTLQNCGWISIVVEKEMLPKFIK